ncbi:MAG: hypothetical protein QF535_07985 [Anaerolineales bacterium]|jgi:hypothetical protein|nr:hypothetical protein [Anaerolineales bacterium]
MIDIPTAIRAINPDAEVNTYGSSHDLDNCTLEWVEGTAEISKADIQAKIDELKAEYDAKEYQRKRKSEYPDIYDYMDGIVKNDQTQIDKYIADCQAVKNKFPKENA